MSNILTITLPPWLTTDGKPGWYAVDSDRAYPLAMDALKVVRPNQFFAELAYLLIGEAVRRLVPGRPGRVRFTRSERWALRSLPPREGMAVVGADADPVLAKAQVEINTRAARLEVQRRGFDAYAGAIRQIMRG